MTAGLAIPENAKAITTDWMRRAPSLGGAVDPPVIRNVVIENIGAGSGATREILRCHRVRNRSVPKPSLTMNRALTNEK